MAFKHRPTNGEFVSSTSSIKSISQYCVDAPVKFQPEGPIFLGGHSVGATIALEMSQQLLERGREVSLLVIFDGWLLNTGAEISLLNPIYSFNLLCYLPRWINEVLMVKYSFQDACRMLVKKFSSRHGVEGVVNLSAYTPAHAAFMRGLYDRHLEYVPNSYSGRVLVCRQTDELLNHGHVNAA